MLMSSLTPLGELENAREFESRHIGLTEVDQAHMLSVIGEASRRSLIEGIVPVDLGQTDVAGFELAGVLQLTQRCEARHQHGSLS
jgi:glycine dehydrogenase